MARDRNFSPEFFEFLAELRDNNSREWFQNNKERYQTTVREPLLRFISDFSGPLHEISPYFVADPRPTGGSMFRIYRDVRFSKDKSPYKTHAAAQFRHRAGRDAHAPGFYLHLEPGACFAGVGMWKPEAKVARKIRDGIFEDPDGWKKATKRKAFTDTWDLSVEDEEKLKRVPKEYGDDFVYADDVRMKSFIAGSRLTQKAVTSKSFDNDLAKLFAKASGLTEFLCKAVGLPF